MQGTALCALSLVVAAACAPVAGAQSEPPRGGPFFRVGAGLGNASNTITGDGANHATGFVGTVQGGIGGQRVQFVVAFDWQPFQVESPVAAEAVSLWYLVGGV